MFINKPKSEDSGKIQKMYEVLDKINKGGLSLEVTSYWTGGYKTKVSYFNTDNILCTVERRNKDIIASIIEAGFAAFDAKEKDKKDKMRKLEEEMKKLTN